MNLNKYLKINYLGGSVNLFVVILYVEIDSFLLRSREFALMALELLVPDVT